MTQEQADRFLMLLAEGFVLLREMLRDGLESPGEARWDTPREQGGPVYGEGDEALFKATLAQTRALPNKRKRGRPRLSLEEKMRRLYEKNFTAEEIAIIQSHQVSTPPRGDLNGEEDYTCSHCNRILPKSVQELHEGNCAAAKRGYATHESRKPDGSSTLL